MCAVTSNFASFGIYLKSLFVYVIENHEDEKKDTSKNIEMTSRLIFPLAWSEFFSNFLKEKQKSKFWKKKLNKQLG